MTTAQAFFALACLLIACLACFLAGRHYERSQHEPEPTDSEYEADQDRRST